MKYPPSVKIGIGIIVLFALCACFAPWISPCDPNACNIKEPFLGSSAAHLIGTDADGRDVLSLIIYGARTSLAIAFAVAGISLVTGCFAGLLAGFSGGVIDSVFVFVTDVFMAFPSFIFALTVAAFLEPSIINIIFILSLKGWIGYARLTRGRAIALKEREFVKAEKILGAGKLRVMLRHLLPNMTGLVVVNLSFGLAGIIMIESALSFLGFGVPVGTPSWGLMLEQGTRYLLVAPKLSIYPGIAIMLTVLGFNLVGEGLKANR